jgi:hypothetical protein
MMPVTLDLLYRTVCRFAGVDPSGPRSSSRQPIVMAVRMAFAVDARRRGFNLMEISAALCRVNHTGVLDALARYDQGRGSETVAELVAELLPKLASVRFVRCGSLHPQLGGNLEMQARLLASVGPEKPSTAPSFRERMALVERQIAEHMARKLKPKRTMKPEKLPVEEARRLRLEALARGRAIFSDKRMRDRTERKWTPRVGEVWYTRWSGRPVPVTVLAVGAGWVEIRPRAFTSSSLKRVTFVTWQRSYRPTRDMLETGPVKGMVYPLNYDRREIA